MSSADERKERYALADGFLFLEDFRIQIVPEDKSASETPQNDGKWHAVQIQQESKPASEETKEFDRNRRFCSDCCISMARQPPSEESPTSFMLVEPTPRFDGTVSDVKPSENQCKCSSKLRQRSDGALLLGLALTCHDMGHVIVRSIDVRIKRGAKDATSLERVLQSTDDSEIFEAAASLLITISVPEIATTKQPAKRRFISNSAKQLAPATQLLLCLLRSDWVFFDSLHCEPGPHDRKSSGNAHRKHPSSFFPLRLSLGEVYERIGGASTSADNIEQVIRLQVSDKSTSVELPNDIWKHHIGSYLKARSLDALRCTNKYFHQTLRAIVPGLRLKLYEHQIRSLSWMRAREMREITENDLSLWTDTQGNKDLHTAASGGATVVLRSKTCQQPYRISQYTGEEVLLETSNPLPRKVARGGLLCDDPGLGKTITVLSLLLQTFGVTTEKEGNEKGSEMDAVPYKERIFQAYWMEHWDSTSRKWALNKLLSTFIRNNAESSIFIQLNPTMAAEISKESRTCLCLKEIRKRIEANSYDESFQEFTSDVVSCFRHNHCLDEHREIASRLVNRFQESVTEFKEKQVQVARKSFSKLSSKPGSSVAVLVEKSNREEFQKALIKSAGTLLVVPSVLLEHWEDQIRLHVNVSYCTNKTPITFHFTGTAENNLLLEKVIRQCQVDKTHFPFLFIDKTGSRKLPSPEFLSIFLLVITTNQRFTNEWKNGPFEEERRGKKVAGMTTEEQGNSFESYLADETQEACSLLKIKWLRMIVDEGHSMGKGRANSAILFASWVTAERRWAMTGTPTRQTASNSSLHELNNLIAYLQHDFFSSRHDGNEVWQQMIARGWSQGQMSAFFRLLNLLSLLMVRHTKMDIVELPLPQHEAKLMAMGMEEIKTYNTLVCAIQSNLGITAMEGKVSGLQDSLLHRSQQKFAKEALRNVRLVCTGGTQVIPTISDEFWNEFLADFGKGNRDPALNRKMEDYLRRATRAHVSACDCCGMLLTTLLVFPCGDLICTECFDPSSNRCILCDKQFDIDFFQRLQPGMIYNWLHNIEEERRSGKTATSSSPDHTSRAELLDDGGRGILAPVDPSRESRRTAKPNDGHRCVYTPKKSNGECELCWEQHGHCNMLNDRHRCEICFRTASYCPEYETKPFYITNKIISLVEEHSMRNLVVCKAVTQGHTTTSMERPPKVIVFSQFRGVLNTVGDRLIRRCGTACIAEYWGLHRKQALHQFKYDKDCCCMLLGKDGSEGLDLSFVTHIIFMEQIWDKALEQQVIARAWRMGATASVQVEVLIAQSSVEEDLMKLEADIHGANHQISKDVHGMQTATEAGKIAEYHRARLHFLLKNLRLISNSDTNPLAPGSTKRELPSLSTPDMASHEERKRKRRRVRFDCHNHDF